MSTQSKADQTVARWSVCLGCEHRAGDDCTRHRQAVGVLLTRERGCDLWPWDTSQPSRGLGDTIAKLTTALGVKPCNGCKDRQQALNQLVPYTGEAGTKEASNG